MKMYANQKIKVKKRHKEIIGILEVQNKSWGVIRNIENRQVLLHAFMPEKFLDLNRFLQCEFFEDAKNIEILN